MIKIIRDKFGAHTIEGKDLEKFDWTKGMKKPIAIEVCQMPEDFEVQTLEGTMQGKQGDWLMKGVKGEMYPCDKDIFKKSYDIIS